MPTYEYLCQSCGARFEAWQKITDDPIETCPTCGQHVRRVLYPVGLVFKGSGFYRTDNRPDSSTAASAASAASTPSTSSSESASASTSSESTPASKPATAAANE